MIAFSSARSFANSLRVSCSFVVGFCCAIAGLDKPTEPRRASIIIIATDFNRTYVFLTYLGIRDLSSVLQ